LTQRVIGARPSTVRGDRRRVQQILLNLGNNAIKFTSHGTVTMSVHEDGADLVFSVRDDGPGIAQEQQRRLFQRFAQTTLGHRAGGAGLGLAICRELVQQMGGRIELDSAPGQGSEFRVHLPLPKIARPAFRGVAETPAEYRVTGSRQTLTLLLVEDDEHSARAIEGLLKMLGHRVRHAPHALAALSELARGGIDLVLCDLDLPDVDGLALLRAWRKRENSGNTAPIPFVALTARSEAEIETQALAAGMQAFQRKPVTSTLLLALLRPWCG
jgi:CheY-like chemotaxis protein